MNSQSLFKSVPVRIVVFLWMFAFPIVFVGLPAVEMYMGERENNLSPLWAFGVWILGPWAAMIVIKYAGVNSGEAETQKD